MTTLRELHWSDLPELAELERELFADDAWAEPTWWAELAGRPRRSYVLAHNGETVLGYAGLDLAGDLADVMTIAVAPRAQGRGTGRRLLDWLVQTATDSGAEALLLEVRADNGRALDLYRRTGFDQINVRRRYYQPGNVDALILRRLLAEETHD